MSASGADSTGAFAPLRVRTFRRIWSASLLSNFGHLILGVAAGWEMTRLTDSAEMVALVQSAMMLPLMLVSVPAGAIADMFDRRKIAITGLAFSIASAILLTVFTLMDMITPWMLLGFCVLIGGGVALYSPAWQASISEQVEPVQLPAAVALGTISYNIARSFGPAVGGIIVLAAGAQAAFAMNALFYAPLLIAFLLWQRKQVANRLPPERIDRAIVSGARYALHAPVVRNIVVRAFLFGMASAAASALAPLVARDLLKGDAGIYGILLGAGGVGAVAGAILVSHVRQHFRHERAIAVCLAINAAAIALLGMSQNLFLTCGMMLVAGGANIMVMALFNVSVQMSVPRWVTARALSLFAAALTGGVALGAWVWGRVAAEYGLEAAFLISALAIFLSPLLALALPIQSVKYSETEVTPVEGQLDIALDLSLRSGPIIIEIDYFVEPDRAREFYNVMRQMQRARQRLGAFNWTLARDISNPALWTERYQCPTWGDYLRQRSRFTQADRALQSQANAFHTGAAQAGETLRLGAVEAGIARPAAGKHWLHRPLNLAPQQN